MGATSQKIGVKLLALGANRPDRRERRLEGLFCDVAMQDKPDPAGSEGHGAKASVGQGCERCLGIPADGLSDNDVGIGLPDRGERRGLGERRCEFAGTVDIEAEIAHVVVEREETTGCHQACLPKPTAEHAAVAARRLDEVERTREDAAHGCSEPLREADGGGGCADN